MEVKFDVVEDRIVILCFFLLVPGELVKCKPCSILHGDHSKLDNGSDLIVRWPWRSEVVLPGKENHTTNRMLEMMIITKENVA